MQEVWTEAISEQSTEESICTQETGVNGRMEKTAQSGAS
jgi:hypothetical protein